MYSESVRTILQDVGESAHAFALLAAMMKIAHAVPSWSKVEGFIDPGLMTLHQLIPNSLISAILTRSTSPADGVLAFCFRKPVNSAPDTVRSALTSNAGRHR